MRLLLKKIVYFILDLFLLLFKRNKQVVVCSGWEGRRFADNSRYMFLYLMEHKKACGVKDVVWLTQDSQIKTDLKKAGFKVYMKRSIQSLYYHLHSKYFFYDQFRYDYYTSLTRGAKLINLWHGMPIKKFGIRNGLYWDLKDDYLLTCSVWGDLMIGASFIANPKNFIHGMYPRNYYLTKDIFYLTNDEECYLNMLLQKRQCKKIVFYLPTFRKSKLLFLGESNINIINDFIHFLDLNDYFLVTKIHYSGFSRHHDCVDFSADCFLNLPYTVDIYPFLKISDILITDYSSVLFDFLYLDRPIICYPYDLSTYKNEDQGLLFDYDDLPADIVYSINELKIKLQYLKTGHDDYSDSRKKWLVKSFADCTMSDTINNIFT